MWKLYTESHPQTLPPGFSIERSISVQYNIMGKAPLQLFVSGVPGQLDLEKSKQLHIAAPQFMSANLPSNSHQNSSHHLSSPS